MARSVLAVMAAVPSVRLYHAADPGLEMPAMGLGTGAYGQDPSVGRGGYPECWAEFPQEPDGAGRCGPWVEAAVQDWLRAGGRRLDSANSYSNQAAVGRGLAASGAARADLFLLSKVGSTNPMGYHETLLQARQVLRDLQVAQLDLLLVHWPTSAPTVLNETRSTDPACATDEHGYSRDPKACRLSTWRAMLRLWEEGLTRGVGVSNYNETHFEEIAAAGLPLPAVNQVPLNPSLGRVQAPLRRYLQHRSVTVMAYSPLGVPDLPHARPTNGTLLEEPLVRRLAQRHGKAPAQVLLRWLWQLGVPAHPRSVSPEHMAENLNIYDFRLSDAEMEELTALPQDLCAREAPAASWYQCFPQWVHYPPGNSVHVSALRERELVV